MRTRRSSKAGIGSQGCEHERARRQSRPRQWAALDEPGLLVRQIAVPDHQHGHEIDVGDAKQEGEQQSADITEHRFIRKIDVDRHRPRQGGDKLGNGDTGSKRGRDKRRLERKHPIDRYAADDDGMEHQSQRGNQLPGGAAQAREQERQRLQPAKATSERAVNNGTFK